MRDFTQRLKNVGIRFRVASLAILAGILLFIMLLCTFITDDWMVLGLVFIIFCVVGGLFTKVISMSILEEISDFKNIMEEVASGNLTVKINDSLKTEDEFGSFAVSIEKTLVQLNQYQTYISEVAHVLDCMASGKMKIELVQSYDGQFNVIKDAILEISSSLNKTLQEINQSSDSVAIESEKMLVTSARLSNGTADQASSIEELIASIQEISSQVAANANSALSAKDKVDYMNQTVNNSNEKMIELLEAMGEIRKSSNDIVNIIQTIEEIASKTNLLSLNASIEAARAGESGRGFAVVAHEIGNLANQSVGAVRMTSDLIDKTLSAVKKGVALADISANSTKKVSEEATEVTSIMDGISSNSQLQSELLSQFTLAVEQISSVIDKNQQTAIESANMAELLKQQAFLLREKVEEFELY